MGENGDKKGMIVKDYEILITSCLLNDTGRKLFQGIQA